MTTRYLANLTVVAVEQRKRIRSARKNEAGETVVEYEDLGWWVVLENHQSLCVGPDKPSITPGCVAKIVLEDPP